MVFEILPTDRFPNGDVGIKLAKRLMDTAGSNEQLEPCTEHAQNMTCVAIRCRFTNWQ